MSPLLHDILPLKVVHWVWSVSKSEESGSRRMTSRSWPSNSSRAKTFSLKKFPYPWRDRVWQSRVSVTNGSVNPFKITSTISFVYFRVVNFIIICCRCRAQFFSIGILNNNKLNNLSIKVRLVAKVSLPSLRPFVLLLVSFKAWSDLFERCGENIWFENSFDRTKKRST